MDEINKNLALAVKESESAPASPTSSNVVPGPGFFGTPAKSEAASPQKLDLSSTTDVLLFAIYQELKAHNEIELVKLKREDDLREAEQRVVEAEEKENEARFEEIRNTMFL